MHLFTICRTVAVLMVVSSPVALDRAAAQADSKDPALDAAQALLGRNWIVEAEALAAGERILPSTRSFLGRLKARGAFPYAKILLRATGEELVRTESRELTARAAAKRLRIRVRDGKPEIEAGGGENLGLRKTLRVLLERYRPAGPDAGSALSASLAMTTVLTVRGRLESATVRPTDSGLEVRVSWKQGGRWWAFEEHADWTFRFTATGALVSIDKAQKTFTRRKLR